MSGEEDTLKPVELKAADDEDVVALKLLDLGKTISTWKSYSFGNDFMHANSSWNFEVADDNLFNLVDKIQTGQRVAVTVNGTVQSTGYLDQVHIVSSRNGGTILQLRGRDTLGPMADACIDPKFRFDGLQTPKDLIKKLSAPFGFTDVVAMDFVNVEKLTGVADVLLTNETGRIVVEKILNTPMNSKFKPHPGEGVYAFCERIGRRFGYHVWASADGKTLIVGTPTFNSKPIYSITHSNSFTSDNPKNLALDAELTLDWTKQPTAIIAEGHGGGGHFRKQSIKAIMVNELLGDTDNADIKKLKSDYKEAKIITRRSTVKKPSFIKAPSFSKPMFVHDDSSSNKDQLSNFVRRLMAEKQSEFLTVRYTLNRHSQKYKGHKAVWTPNTIVYVDDAVNNIHQNMWVKSRTFTKDRDGGTKTTIECIIPYTLELFPTNE